MTRYKVLRDGKNFGKKLFNTYEEARSFVRKYIRKDDPLAMPLFSRSNPPISDYGFKIQQT